MAIAGTAWTAADLAKLLSTNYGGLCSRVTATTAEITVVTRRDAALDWAETANTAYVRVWYGTGSTPSGWTDVTATVNSGAQATILTCSLSGLAADTEYCYALEVETDTAPETWKYVGYPAGEVPRFRTLATSASDGEFVFIGDIHEQTAFAAKDIDVTYPRGWWNQWLCSRLWEDSDRVDFIAQMGDFQMTRVDQPANQDEADTVCERNRNGPFYRMFNRAHYVQVPGNHESNGTDATHARCQAARVKYTPNPDDETSDETFFTFDTCGARFIFLDPWAYTAALNAETDFTLGAGYDFLRRTLDTYVRPTLVVLHNLAGGYTETLGSNPVYARGSGIESINAGQAIQQKRVHTLLRRGGVVGVIKAHDHRWCHRVVDGIHYVSIGPHGYRLGSALWGYAGMVASYGSVLPDTLPPNVLKFMDMYGYARFSISGDVVRMRWIKTTPLMSQKVNANPFTWTYPGAISPGINGDSYAGSSSTVAAGPKAPLPAGAKIIVGVYTEADHAAYLAGDVAAPTTLHTWPSATNVFDPTDADYSGGVAISGAAVGDTVYVEGLPETVYDVELAMPPKITDSVPRSRVWSKRTILAGE